MSYQEKLADYSVTVTSFKKKPMAAVKAGNGFPIVVLNDNKPAFYCVPASAYKALMDRLEDQELNEIADSRKVQKSIRVSFDEL